MAKRAAKKRTGSTGSSGAKRPAAKAAAKRKPQTSVKAATAPAPAPAKKKSKAAKPAAQSAPVASDARIRDLEDQLAVAEARIAELEATQADVLNRVDWVLDSLKTSLEPSKRRGSK